MIKFNSLSRTVDNKVHVVHIHIYVHIYMHMSAKISWSQHDTDHSLKIFRKQNMADYQYFLKLQFSWNPDTLLQWTGHPLPVVQEMAFTLTHWGWDEMAAILLMTFWITLNENICIESNWQYVSIGSDNGLAPSRRKAIIWTNAWWCHMASVMQTCHHWFR